MDRTTRVFLIAACSAVIAPPAIADSLVIRYNPPRKVSSGIRQDIDYSLYINSIEVDVRRGIRVANFERRSRISFGPRAGETFNHRGRWVADCENSKLDGQEVMARPKAWADRGKAEILNAICDARMPS